MPDVRWLHEVRRTDVPLVGGKAANLGELVANGFPVPPGFVVTAPACRRFFEAIELAAQLADLNAASSADRDVVLARIAARIREAPLPRELEQEIRDAHAELRAQVGPALVCVVRSSATAEDTGSASFAGQHGTYYYVDEPRLIVMVRNCWASLWSLEAVTYRATQGVDHATAWMAVIVQQMVPSQVSGVTFTVNPVTGDRDAIVIESSWGMGAGIVDGRVTPDRYVLRRPGLGVVERRIAQKRVRVSTTLRPDAVGRVVQVPHEQRLAETISSATAAEIARWALRAEAVFGSPQDVEWAVAGDTMYVLQSRPVTVSGRQSFCRNAAGGKYVLFKPLAENFTDPITPLTANLFLQGIPGRAIALVGGRAYLDLALVRRILPLRLTDEELAGFLYLSGERRVRPRLAPARLPAALVLGAFMLLSYANFMVRTAHLPADFMDGFRRAAERYDRDDDVGPAATWRELMLGWFPGVLFMPAGRQVLFLNVLSMRYFMWMAALRAVLRHYVPDLPRDALGVLTSGSEGVLSAEAGRRIRELAHAARANEAVARLLRDHSGTEALEILRATPAAAEFVAQLDAFLQVYGHRAVREFEFRSLRWEEEPAQVLGLVRNLMAADPGAADHEAATQRRRSELARAIADRLAARPLERKFGLRRRLIDYLAGRVKHYARIRENSRFYWVMAAYVTRKKLLRLEARLIREGRLRTRDDIFFLELHEIEDLEQGRRAWSDVEPRIAARRRDYVRFSKMTPPRTIGLDSSGETAAPPPLDATVLKGETASPGRCEGPARVILDPSVDAALAPGEILVAPYTDPAWTPLFLTAGAAVVEVGSFLSHAGTVAREYGLPCVVDVAECTTRIRTGDRLAVDGDHGEVRILSRAES